MLGLVKRFAMNPKVIELLKPAFGNAKDLITPGGVPGLLAPCIHSWRWFRRRCLDYSNGRTSWSSW